MDTYDPAVMVFDESSDLVLHEKLKVRIFCGPCSEEVEKIPLGHESNEF